MCSSATLKYVIDVRHGLLDDLFSAELLDDDEMEQILSETKESEAVNRLMQYYAKLSRDQQQQFREHLDRSGQAHVTQFIVSNGQRPADNDNDNVADVWPLYVSREWKKLKNNRSKLIELIDSRHGLVDELMQDGCLNRRQYDALNSEREDGQRNTKLLNILQRKSVRDFRKFLRCLEKTEQHHVVEILEGVEDDRETRAEVKPLCEQQKFRLIANLTYLIDNIEMTGRGLLTHLLSTRCITLRQKGYVESAPEPAEGNRRLLEILQRSSQKKFDSFVNCLNKTGQQHLAMPFDHDGVVAQIVVNISCPAGDDPAAVERCIVDEFKGLLAKSDGEKRQKLLKELFEPVELVGMKTHCSIKLFFFCRSLSGLRYLNDLYTTDGLSKGVVGAFNILLTNKKPLKVDRLVWEKSDYERCVTVLSESDDRLLPTLSDQRKCTKPEDTSELLGSKHEQLRSSTAGRLRKSIEGKRSGLLHLIDLHHGLLSHLREEKTLSEEQVTKICQKGTEVDQVGQLLDEVVSLSGDDQERFMVALEKTRQQHVVDRIMDDKIDEGDEKNDGKPWQFSKRRNRAKEPLWPLLYSEEWGYLDRSWCQFLETVDCVCGLPEELVQRGCINQQHLEDIKSTPIQSLQNLKLLQIFRRKSVGDFHKLLESLKATKQYYIESLLNPQKDESTKPLMESQKMALHANKFALIEIIDAKNAESNLVDEMMRYDCITRRQNELIKSAKTVTEANERLLKILEYGCLTDFRKFIDVLRKRKQYEACSLLNGEGVCACIQAVTVQSGKGHLPVTIDRNVPNESPIGLKNLTTADAAACRRMVQLIATRTCADSSLRLLFKCRTPDELHFLRQSYGTRILKLIIEKVLAVLYDTKSIKIATIQWNLADYLHSVSFMYKLLSLDCLAEIYKLAIESKETASESTNWKPIINQLPYELVRYVLMKSLGRLFHCLRAMTSRAELYSVVSVMSVCHNWWDEVASWKGVNHRVKRSIKASCYPYRPTAKKVKKVELDDGWFYGIAQASGKIYVLAYILSTLTTVLVFKATFPYNFLNKIEAPIIMVGTDIVASNTSGRLYVSGYLDNCIWRIDTDEGNVVNRFISVSVAPWTLSLNNERLLVTFHGGSILKIYNTENGDLVRDIVLPKNIYAYHAKELIDGTIVVCHLGLPTSTSGQPPGHDGISQFAVPQEGSTPEQLRFFTSDVVPSTPYCVDMDRAGNVLLADRSRRTVAVLKPTDKRYQTDHLLVCNTGQHPKRMCYSDDTRLLCVCFYDVHSIRFYKV